VEVCESVQQPVQCHVKLGIQFRTAERASTAIRTAGIVGREAPRIMLESNAPNFSFVDWGRKKREKMGKRETGEGKEGQASWSRKKDREN